MKNVKLLQDTLSWIKAHPESHNQGDWGHYDSEACETSMCFAGHAAILSGATFDKDIYLEECDWTVNAETGKHVYTEYVEGDDEWDDSDLKPGTEHVADFAAKKLGVSGDERSYLFGGMRSLQELEEAVDKFSTGHTYTFNGLTREWGFIKEEN